MVVSRIWNLLKHDASGESWAPGFRSGLEELLLPRREYDFTKVHSDAYTLECMGVEVEEAILGLKSCVSLEFNITFVAAQLATEHLSTNFVGLGLLGKLGSGLASGLALAAEVDNPYFRTSAKEPHRA